MTDVEFVELRQTGNIAAVLRSFRALYLGLSIHCLIIGLVNLAILKILSVTLEWNRLSEVFIGLAATGLYSSLAGLRKVVVTDLIQFGLAMTGSVALAWFALAHPDVGGLERLLTQLAPPTFELVPRLEADASASATFALPVAAFVASLGVR